MKCPNHLTRNVAGYCCVCGSFYCDDCLTHHEGNVYCRKHYRPIAAKLEEERRRAESRKRHARHSLVVHFRDGRKAQGVCHAMNIRESGFHLECEDDNHVATGETQRVRFAEIKCVCNVKSYGGKFDPQEGYQEYTPGGSEVVVEFQDGEIMEGATLHAYDPDQPRFYLIPNDSNSNNINVLVEHAATANVYTREEWDRKKAEEAEQRRAQKAAPVAPAEAAELSQEETMGDFYFEQHNYAAALEQYNIASDKFPGSGRLRKKRLVATVNVGINFMKKRDYPKALTWMEKALEIDPENPHAKKKAKQLRKVIEKTEKRMKAYYEGKLSSGSKDPEPPNPLT